MNLRSPVRLGEGRGSRVFPLLASQRSWLLMTRDGVFLDFPFRRGPRFLFGPESPVGCPRFVPLGLLGRPAGAPALTLGAFFTTVAGLEVLGIR